MLGFFRSGGVEIFSGGVEIFSVGLRYFKRVEKLSKEIEKFQGFEKYSGGLRSFQVVL